MPRYVILEHDWPQKHWDFMLEAGTVLQTWKLADVPKPGVAIRTEESSDHRLMYLDYEGPISDGRGTVTRWDTGTFEVLNEEENRRVVRLKGERFKGTAELSNLTGTGWTLVLQD
jgi:DNA polymerase Ligase (LigD)